MRIEKEYNLQGMKATLFTWNNKFLLKFEQGGLEQTYKFSELDYTMEEIEAFTGDRFVQKVASIFNEMNKNLQSALM